MTPGLVIVFSAVLGLSCGRTDRITQRITDADDRLTHVNTVGVSNKRYTCVVAVDRCVLLLQQLSPQRLHRRSSSERVASAH